MQLHESHPDIKLSIDASERLADVARGEVDLAVRYGPPFQATGMRSLQLCDDRYIAVASPRWAAARDIPMPPMRLARERLLGYTWKNARLQGPTWGRWMAHAAVADFDEGQCVQFSEESHAIQAAIDGAGVALASDVLVGQDLRTNRLTQVCEATLQGLTFQCLSRASNLKVDAIRQVEDWLKTLMPRPHAE